MAWTGWGLGPCLLATRQLARSCSEGWLSWLLHSHTATVQSAEHIACKMDQGRERRVRRQHCLAMVKVSCKDSCFEVHELDARTSEHSIPGRQLNRMARDQWQKPSAILKRLKALSFPGSGMYPVRRRLLESCLAGCCSPSWALSVPQSQMQSWGPFCHLQRAPVPLSCSVQPCLAGTLSPPCADCTMTAASWSCGACGARSWRKLAKPGSPVSHCTAALLGRVWREG